MKLNALTEATDLTPADVKKAGQKNLIMDVGDSHIARVYIITDVPRITKAQFEQLYNTSFEPGSLTDQGGHRRHGIDIYPAHLDEIGEENWYEWLEEFYPIGAIKEIERVPWKVFVAKMKTTYPFVQPRGDFSTPDEEHDDFDE